LRAARGRPGEAPRFVFTELLEAVELAGGSARWIDPDVRAVRTPLHALGWQRVRSPSGAWLLVEAPANPLDACRLEDGGLWAPADTAQSAIRPAHLEELAREVDARTERHRQLDEHHRAVAAYAERRKAGQEAAWSVYRRTRFANPDAVPSILTEVGTEDAGIADYLPVHWHARLFEEVIQGRLGSSFTYRRAASLFLASPTARQPAVYRALSGYLERLRRAGFVEYRTDSVGHIRTEIRVLADTKQCPVTRSAEKSR
jgi:hypothetical protein